MDMLYERIREAFPGVNLDNAVVNADGMVNVAIIAEGYVYRFARADWAVPALQQESAVLRLIRDHVTMRVPSFTVIADDFVRYRFIEGEPLTRNTILQLPDYDQDWLAEQLASFLSQLHSVPLDQLQDAGIGQSGGRQSQNEWLELYDHIQRELYPLMYRITRDHIDQHFSPLVNDPNWLDFQPTLIHDDLAQYHILYDPADCYINGIIDFGTAGLGDPARDYGILINVFGESFVARMAKYDSSIEACIERARFYHGTAELQWLLIGVRQQSFAILTAHLDRARDVKPYGMPLNHRR
ncbi:MAG: phosphotransferase [Anaerolineae bacterium]